MSAKKDLIEHFESLPRLDIVFQNLLVDKKRPHLVRRELNIWIPEMFEKVNAFLNHEVPWDQIRCSSGCSHCCHHYPQSVDPFESLYIFMRIQSRVDFPSILTICHENRSCLDKLRGGEEVTDRVLHDYYKLARPCAFLNPHGECSIYEFRPNTCRLYLSKSDPTFCASDWILQGDNLNFLAELPDAVEKCIDDFNELWIDFGIPDSFFEALLWWHDFLEMKDQNHNGIDH